MAYKLYVTKHAEELLDNLVNYLITEKLNPDAALHLLNEIESVYERLRDNPFQFRVSQDRYLMLKEYREVVITGMDYVVVYDVSGDIVTVLGIFHQLENYRKKV